MRHKIVSGLTCAICLITINAGAQYLNEGYLPHIANGSFAGGSFRTTLILFNNTNDNDAVGLRLTGDDGKPLVLTIPGLGTGSEFSINLAPGASRIFQTDGSGSLVTGAARITSMYQVGVSAIFSIYDPAGHFLTEAGVGDSPALSQFVIPVDVTGNFNTGLALFNPAPVETSVELALMDSAGKEAGKSSLTIGSGGHLARFIAGPGQLFPSTADFRGTLAVTSTNSQISALTLRQNGMPLSYTSLPVVHSADLVSEIRYLPQVANGSYGGGSFRSSFLFLNISSTPAKVHLSLRQSLETGLEVTLVGMAKGSDFDLTLKPNGSAFLQTDGSGPLTVGVALIHSDVPIGVFGIFSVFDTQGQFQTEAGVGSDISKWDLTIPVDITGNFDTGVAFFNPGITPEELTLRLLDQDGEIKAVKTKFTLPGWNHTVQFVSELFPGISNFRGSLSVSGVIVALTLRQNSSPLSYTTLPVSVGASHGRVFPLAPQTKTGITVAGNVTVDATLATGFRLTGSIEGPGYPGLVAAQSSTGEVIGGRIGYSPSGRRYMLVLPAGTYALKVCYEAEGYADITFTDPTLVQVSADATRDITLPTVTLTDISGTVAGLSSLPPMQSKAIVFNTRDDSVWTQLWLDDDGKYSGRIAPGSYRANLYLPNVQFPDGRWQHMTAFDFGAVNVGSSPVVANFTLPPLASLSGLMSGPDAGMARICATDRSAPAIANDSCGYFPGYNSTATDASGQYQLTLVKDREYDVQALQPVTRYGGLYFGTVRYPVPASIVNLSSDSRLNFSAPSLPDGVVISGKVTDSTGRGVGDVEIEVVSKALTGAPGVQSSQWERTDADGTYSVKVLSGTNYKLMLYPPVPAP